VDNIGNREVPLTFRKLVLVIVSAARRNETTADDRLKWHINKHRLWTPLLDDEWWRFWYFHRRLYWQYLRFEQKIFRNGFIFGGKVLYLLWFIENDHKMNVFVKPNEQSELAQTLPWRENGGW